MQNETNFKAATLLYYEGKYQQALLAINQYLQVKPSSSMGFNNRALIQAKLGSPTLAKEDIFQALQITHLNYVAYFNLFSIYSQENNYPQSLLALQAGTSSLLLIKGRLLKDKSLL